jgi:KUP system potassium uptake protein
MPPLVLNYLGRTSSEHATGVFRMFPQWSLIPMVLLATVATVIASQAVISGAFSMTNLAISWAFCRG